MTDLTAIDILVNPDDVTLERARRANARMRGSVPSGFSLDATHQPHVTTLQRYVRSADLDEVYAAVEATIGATDVAALTYRAVAIGHADWGVPGQGLAAIVLAAQRCRPRPAGASPRGDHAVRRVGWHGLERRHDPARAPTPASSTGIATRLPDSSRRRTPTSRSAARSAGGYLASRVRLLDYPASSSRAAFWRIAAASAAVGRGWSGRNRSVLRSCRYGSSSRGTSPSSWIRP